jgi:hypothetical protein
MIKEKKLDFKLPGYDDYLNYRQIRNDHPFITEDKGATREPIETAEMPENKYQDINKVG